MFKFKNADACNYFDIQTNVTYYEHKTIIFLEIIRIILIE